MVNGLYILDGNTVISENCMAESSQSKMTLWHSRLGHMSINNLKVLADKGFLDRKDIKDLNFCENYATGKSKKLSFNIGKHYAEEALSYVHESCRSMGFFKCNTLNIW